MNPADEQVARAHEDLPALRTVLDPEAIGRLAATWGGGYQVERLRLRPAAAVIAALRPAPGRDAPWLLVRGYSPGTARRHLPEDVQAAQRAGVAWEIDEQQRMFVTAAAADRALPALAGFRPDTGWLVPLPGHPGPAGTVRTLSHNPGRRFVGRWTGVRPGRPGPREAVLRLYSDGTQAVLPWVPGHPWRPGDGPVPLAQLATSGAAGRELPVPDVARALAEVANGVRAIDHAGGDWSSRVRELRPEIGPRLARLPRTAAHGDFSRDQLVAGRQGQVHVLDWDRAGWWPAGWDAATWAVTQWLGALGHPGQAPREALPGQVTGAADPAVVAAVALLRAPEPFRRRRPRWERLTEALIALAEHVLTPSGARR